MARRRRATRTASSSRARIHSTVGVAQVLLGSDTRTSRAVPRCPCLLLAPWDVRTATVQLRTSATPRGARQLSSCELDGLRFAPSCPAPARACPTTPACASHIAAGGVARVEVQVAWCAPAPTALRSTPDTEQRPGGGREASQTDRPGRWRSCASRSGRGPQRLRAPAACPRDGSMHASSQGLQARPCASKPRRAAFPSVRVHRARIDDSMAPPERRGERLRDVRPADWPAHSSLPTRTAEPGRAAYTSYPLRASCEGAEPLRTSAAGGVMRRNASARSHRSATPPAAGRVLFTVSVCSGEDRRCRRAHDDLDLDRAEPARRDVAEGAGGGVVDRRVQGRQEGAKRRPSSSRRRLAWRARGVAMFRSCTVAPHVPKSRRGRGTGTAPGVRVVEPGGPARRRPWSGCAPRLDEAFRGSRRRRHEAARPSMTPRWARRPRPRPRDGRRVEERQRLVVEAKPWR